MNPDNQQQNVPTSAPQTPPSVHSTVINNNGGKKVGPVIAILVIVLILVVAALYLFATRAPEVLDDSAMIREQAQLQAQSQSVQPVTNNSDDTTSLQNDLNASTNGLDNQNF